LQVVQVWDIPKVVVLQVVVVAVLVLQAVQVPEVQAVQVVLEKQLLYLLLLELVEYLVAEAEAEAELQLERVVLVVAVLEPYIVVQELQEHLTQAVVVVDHQREAVFQITELVASVVQV